MKFTQKGIAGLALSPGKNEQIIFDDGLPGFGIRMREGGSRTWIVQYQIGGKQRRMSLGRIGDNSLDDARKAAQRILARVRLGEDPQVDKFLVRAKAPETLSSVVDLFLVRQKVRLKPRSYDEQRRHLQRHWKPLHGVQIRSIDRSMISARLADLTRSSGPAAADRARTALSTLFTWAMRDGFVDINPVAATNRPAIARPRDRVLSDGELKEIWNACPDDDYGRIVRLLLLTGQRRDEIAGVRWSEIDLEHGVIRLPAERTKNSRAHLVPLSAQACALLPDRRKGRDHVFGQGEGAFSGFSRSKAALDARILAARQQVDQDARPMMPWRLHDLRRTAVTGMAEIGVSPHVIEAAVNHMSGYKAGVAGIYNRATYAAEKRDAMNRWGAHIAALVGGDEGKVVPFRKPA